MRAVILYHLNSDQERLVEDYAKDFEKRTGKKIELIDIDSVEGAEFASNRGIMVTPAVVVVLDDGSVAKQWLGRQLPLVDQLLGHMH